MAIDIKVPTVGESISEVTLLKWVKNTGEYVERDEVIAELESEKATFEVNAEKSGVLTTNAAEGDTLNIGDIIASIDDTAVKPESAPGAEQAPADKVPVEAKKPAPDPEKEKPVATSGNSTAAVKATPVASAIIADKGVNPKDVTPSGFSGKIVKEDVLAALANPGRKAFSGGELYSRNERPQKMTSLRKTISRRLVEAKNTTAMLTTFNEVNMKPIMDIRAKYKDKFKEIHGVGLGFMSFFAKACAIALAEWPSVNAYIDGDQILFHDYADISIAVSTPRGLTVPVIRNVESLSMAGVEKAVLDLAKKARDSKLTAEDLTGGTFTITNGGVFGSLISTPIINLPQSAILGMHNIVERPIAENGQVVIRPMMYIALSYDHRIVDGRESVSFLVRVKELLENPTLLLIQQDPIKTLLEL
ncbi:2-oxoglutarate dehydrogenase complex dihydrolipoyllysine-residue succinyltransferase [Niabella sp. CC-SYL272]|uniref:2-oxoglutarate dehydrogenase complex dihydrolipoyllysine-residue succinyltransferase n=1 Tax=Niabella agricola TaxID=2891571 RepID=UPI001F1A38F6|nr:2-oxoglutarate dehydrogenase complex dihydrolipoyllysine-residue succinyltransferase [Niabella agricola]MCF3109081.1 2-oxoglutarate dehydrogenase complex dihydrolipoyllysine-residue succinyltransferase [Niabella agricola]